MKTLFLSIIYVFLLFVDCHAQNSILFSSDFEDQDSSCWAARPNSGGWNFNGCDKFESIGQGTSISLATNETAFSGRKSMKLNFRKNEDYAGSDIRIPDSERVFARYYDYFSSDFDFGFGMKAFRIRSFNESAGINFFDIVGTYWAHSTTGSRDFSGRNNMLSLIHI